MLKYSKGKQQREVQELSRLQVLLKESNVGELVQSY